MIRLLFHCVVLFLVGFTGLSSLTNIILAAFGISFYLPELFLIPAFLILRSEVKARPLPLIRGRNKAKLALAIQTAFIFISIFIGIFSTGNVFDIVTAIRPLLYLCIIVYLVSRYGAAIDLWYLYCVALGVLLGELVNIQFFSISMMDKGHAYVNFMALAFVMLIPYIKGKLWVGLLSTALALVVALMSGFRMGLAVCLIAFLVGMLFYVKNSGMVTGVIIMLAAGFVLVLAIYNIRAIMEFAVMQLGLSEQTAFRVLDKTMDLFSENKSHSDDKRLNLYGLIADDFIPKLLPRGPVGKAVGTYGLYVDVPIVFLYDSFGSIIAWCIAIRYALKGALSFGCVWFRKNRASMKTLSALCFPIIAILFVVNGTFMIYVHVAVFAGFALSGWNAQIVSRKIPR